MKIKREICAICDIRIDKLNKKSSQYLHTSQIGEKFICGNCEIQLIGRTYKYQSI